MKKILTVFALVAALLTVNIGTAFAQDTTPTAITGEIQLIEVVEDATTGESTVVVTLLDPVTNTTQQVTLSLANAESLGLVSTDPNTGLPVVDETLYGTETTIDGSLIIVTPEEEEAKHPVGESLSNYFGELLGVDYDAIMTAHDDGFGFGVIAQALWMANQLDGGTDTFNALLEAKKTGDYSGITLADGSTPENWGDVVKNLKKGENLGSVRSGKANSSTEDGSVSETNQNGKSDKSNGHGNSGGDTDNDGGNGKGKDNGKGNGNGNGKGKP